VGAVRRRRSPSNRLDSEPGQRRGRYASPADLTGANDATKRLAAVVLHLTDGMDRLSDVVYRLSRAAR
jgi:hypothetical protein